MQFNCVLSFHLSVTLNPFSMNREHGHHVTLNPFYMNGILLVLETAKENRLTCFFGRYQESTFSHDKTNTNQTEESMVHSGQINY